PVRGGLVGGIDEVHGAARGRLVHGRGRHGVVLGAAGDRDAVAGERLFVDGQRVDVMIGRAAREHVEGGHVGVGVPAEAGEVGKVKAPGEVVEVVAAEREAGAGVGRVRDGEVVAGLRGVVEIQDADDEAAAQLVVGDGRVGHVLYVAKGA